jgi:hypothetical protein
MSVKWRAAGVSPLIQPYHGAMGRAAKPGLEGPSAGGGKSQLAERTIFTRRLAAERYF